MTARWVRHPGALSRTTLDGFVVLGARTEEPVLMTASAAALWAVLGEATTTRRLTGAIAGTTDAPADPEAREALVAVTLDRLAADGAVQRLE